MKRLIALLLLLTLLLSGCASKEVEEIPPEAEPETEEIEEIVEPVIEETPKTEIQVVITDEKELLNEKQKQLVTAFISSWYDSIGNFELVSTPELYSNDDVQFHHEGIINTQIQIRSAAREDLHLDSCDIQMVIEKTGYEEDGSLKLVCYETTDMKFRALDVHSFLYDMEHIFYLVETSNGSWQIKEHKADDNPYFNFIYSETTHLDENIGKFLVNIKERQENDAYMPFYIQCECPYDREAALAYAMEYCSHRNPDHKAFDAVGGNCMNFASQVLMAGGIPMDYSGNFPWFYEGYNYSVSFINVDYFGYYLDSKSDYGIVAYQGYNYYDGEVGDLLFFGIEKPRHATVIVGLIQDENGETIDYLLCSNTTNYKNFPAGAYYYTWQSLIKIFGYNN